MEAAPAKELLEQLHGMNLNYKFVPPKRRKSTPNTRNASNQSLLSFPAELRNYIYMLSVDSDEKPVFRMLKPPGVCRTSRQRRKESLRVFFAADTFIIEVASPAMFRRAGPGLPTRGHFIRSTDARFAYAGKLVLRPETEALFQNPTHKLCIRNTDLIPVDFAITPGWRCKHLTAILSLRLPEGRGSGRVTYYFLGSSVGSPVMASNQQLQYDLEHITGAALAYLQAQAARASNQGLSASELTALARTVRVLPRTGANALIDI